MRKFSQHARGGANGHEMRRRPVQRQRMVAPPSTTTLASERSVTATAEAAAPDVHANRAVWKALEKLVRDPVPRLCVLRGPPGTGKTVLTPQLVRHWGRRCVQMQCAELAATARNCDALAAEIRATLTRHSLEEGRGEGGGVPAQKAVLFLDDIDTLQEALVPQLQGLLANELPTTVVISCGRTPPRWLQSFAPAPTTLFLSPLLDAELKSLLRSAAVRAVAREEASKAEELWTDAEETVVEACLRAARGDARAFLNALRLHGCKGGSSGAGAGTSSAVRRITPQLDEWTAAATFLYSELTPEGVDQVLETQRPQLLTAIVHANYVDALVNRAPADDPDFFRTVSDRIELLSAAQAMRSGVSTAAEALHLTARITAGVGRSTKAPKHLPKQPMGRKGGKCAPSAVLQALRHAF